MQQPVPSLHQPSHEVSPSCVTGLSQPDYPPGILNLDEYLVTDWESRFEEHRQVLEEEVRVRDRRVERSNMMSAGWELAKLCRAYIRENSSSWRGEEEERRKKRDKERKRLEKKQRAEEQKLGFKKKTIQKKISDTLRELPALKGREILEDNLKQRRFQMREMKENLWKWRGRKPGKMEETKQPTQTDLEEKLRIVEEMLIMSRKEK